jgi:signal transduction histidine kinase
MLRYVLCLFLIFNVTFIGDSQDLVSSFPPAFVKTTWDNGIPIIQDDRRVVYLARIVFHLEHDWADKDWSGKNKDSIMRTACLELGSKFFDRGMFEGSMFYMAKIGSDEYRKMVSWKRHKHNQNMKLQAKLIKVEPPKPIIVEPIRLPVKEIPKETPKEPEPPKTNKNAVMTTMMDLFTSHAGSDTVSLNITITKDDKTELKQDAKILSALPKQYNVIPVKNLKNLTNKIDGQINQLQSERDSLVKANANKIIIASKESAIQALEKEKDIIESKIETTELEQKQQRNKRIFIGIMAAVIILFLAVFVYMQRRTIRVQDGEIQRQLDDISEKNAYLEYAAHLIRHDMHSGINTYIPRGLTGLERRISDEETKRLNIAGSLTMIREGLQHTQKVYKKVHEFTSLVKTDAQIDRADVNIREALHTYLSATSYLNQVELSETLPTISVNETLFCTAIDNLIRNGLKYNDSDEKTVKVYAEDDIYIVIEDNGRGLSAQDFVRLSKLQKQNEQTDAGSGLGLSICTAILNEHGFSVTAEKLTQGTKVKIKVK